MSRDPRPRHSPGVPCRPVRSRENRFAHPPASASGPPEQTTPASSWWPQLWVNQPLCRHRHSLSSVPMHSTSSMAMGPRPRPKRARPGADTAVPQASCPHTTWASRRSQPSSHTVPQLPLKCSSTRPSQRWRPLLSLRATSGKRRHTWSDTPGRWLGHRPSAVAFEEDREFPVTCPALAGFALAPGRGPLGVMVAGKVLWV